MSYLTPIIVDIPLPGLGIIISVFLFLLLHGGMLLWSLATLKTNVGNLAKDIHRLDETLKTMSQYDVRLALIEQATSSAHKRIDVVISKLNVYVPPNIDIK